MMSRSFKVMLAAIGLAAVGCTQSTTTSTSSLSMTGSAQTATVAKNAIDQWLDQLLPMAYALIPTTLVDGSGANVTLDTAWVVIKEVDFKSTETEDSDVGSEEVEDTIEFNGPYFVNLLSSQPQILDTQQISANTIRRVKMKFENNCDDAQLPSGAPSELGANSIVLKGTVGSSHFTFQSDDGVELVISGAGGIASSQDQTLLISVQLANIIKQINLTSVTDNVVISSSNPVAASNPCPAIDAGASDLYACFKKGFEQQSSLGKDDDHSGEIESDEDSVED